MGDLASIQAVTRVSAERASREGNAEADSAESGGRPQSLESMSDGSSGASCGMQSFSGRARPDG